MPLVIAVPPRQRRQMLSYFPPTSPYAGETMRETVRLLFFSHHPLRRRTHERRRVIRGFLAMAAHVRCLSPTHTHTRNAGSPRNNTKRTRCVTHLLIVIDVVAIQGRRVGNCKLPWAPPLRRFVVGKLPHSHRLCSKCVGGEEEARKKLRRSLHRTPSSSSSPSSLFSHTAYAASV